MSDPVLGMIDPTRFFPRLRKVVAAIVRPALRRVQGYGHRAEERQKSDLMAWCADNFEGEKATFHFLRIKRRIEHKGLMLKGKFERSSIRHYEPPEPGCFLLFGDRVRRRR